MLGYAISPAPARREVEFLDCAPELVGAIRGGHPRFAHVAMASYVHIAARICALGGSDEVMTTATVRDLAVGSMLAFEPRRAPRAEGCAG